MRILSIYNIKGGVGKTAAAVNLAHLAAQSGLRTLIWDLDPQGASTFYFRVKPKVKGGGKKIVKGKTDLDDLIKGTDFENLEILPSDFSYREFDIRFADEKESRLRKLMRPLKNDYDLVIFDCPPSISELSEQIFRASDILLVPLLPTTLSVRTWEQLTEFLGKADIKVKVRSFFSMADKRRKMHRDTISQFTADVGGNHYDAIIPYSSAVERMGEERKPVTAFSPRSAPAKGFEDLWAKVSADLKLD